MDPSTVEEIAAIACHFPSGHRRKQAYPPLGVFGIGFLISQLIVFEADSLSMNLLYRLFSKFTVLLVAAIFLAVDLLKLTLNILGVTTAPSAISETAAYSKVLLFALLTSPPWVPTIIGICILAGCTIVLVRADEFVKRSEKEFQEVHEAYGLVVNLKRLNLLNSLVAEIDCLLLKLDHWSALIAQLNKNDFSIEEVRYSVTYERWDHAVQELKAEIAKVGDLEQRYVAGKEVAAANLNDAQLLKVLEQPAGLKLSQDMQERFEYVFIGTQKSVARLKAIKDRLEKERNVLRAAIG